MFIKSVTIKNFRNILNCSLKFKKGFNLIVAPNATGKTNVLEAISVLSYGYSVRAKDQKDLSPSPSLLTRTQNPLFHKDLLNSLEASNNLDILYNNPTTAQAVSSLSSSSVSKIPQTDLQPTTIEGLVDTKRGQKKVVCRMTFQAGRVEKAFLIDKRKVNFSQFVGNLFTIFFSSSTIDLVSRSPSLRRKFVDNIMVLLYPGYYNSILEYHKSLIRRNFVIRSGKLETLDQWSKITAHYGAILISQRNIFFKSLNKFLEKQQSGLEVVYKPSVEIDDVFDEDPESKFLYLLNKERQNDIKLGRTTIGPHLDDWQLFSVKNDEKRNLGRFGSRGEQRVGMSAVVFSLVSFVGEILGDKPVILADDIFSDLDERYQEILLNRSLDIGCQVIATSTPNVFMSIKKFERFGNINAIEFSLD